MKQHMHKLSHRYNISSLTAQALLNELYAIRGVLREYGVKLQSKQVNKIKGLFQKQKNITKER